MRILWASPKTMWPPITTTKQRKRITIPQTISSSTSTPTETPGLLIWNSRSLAMGKMITQRRRRLTGKMRRRENMSYTACLTTSKSTITWNTRLLNESLLFKVQSAPPPGMTTGQFSKPSRERTCKPNSSEASERSQVSAATDPASSAYRGKEWVCYYGVVICLRLRSSHKHNRRRNWRSFCRYQGFIMSTRTISLSGYSLNVQSYLGESIQ